MRFYAHLEDSFQIMQAACVERFADSCCGIFSLPSGRPWGNICLESLIVLEMCYHSAEKKRSFKGADSLLQLTLSLCRSQSVKTHRI